MGFAGTGTARRRRNLRRRRVLLSARRRAVRVEMDMLRVLAGREGFHAFARRPDRVFHGRGRGHDADSAEEARLPVRSRALQSREQLRYGDEEVADARFEGGHENGHLPEKREWQRGKWRERKNDDEIVTGRYQGARITCKRSNLLVRG